MVLRTRLLLRLAATLAVCLMCGAGAFASSAAAATIVGNVSVQVGGSQVAGQQGDYSITFISTSGMAAGGWITLSAPSGTVFPSGTDSYWISESPDNTFYLAHIAAVNVANNGSQVSLELYSNVTIGAGDTVTLGIGGNSPLGGTYPGVTNPTTAGSYYLQMWTDADTTPASSNWYTIDHGPAAEITSYAGNGETAQVTNQFLPGIAAYVADQYGNPVGGETVTFTAPSAGATGTFGGPATDTETTAASGVAWSKSFFANTVAGSYQVQASDGSLSTTFSLTNTAGPAAAIAIKSGSDQSVALGQSFQPFSAQVTDAYGNPTPGVPVTFEAPGPVPSGTFASSGGTLDTDTTDASGVATSSVLTADQTAGKYQIRVSAAGVTAVLFNVYNYGPAQFVKLSVNPSTITANGRSTATATATVTDALGDPVTGDTVAFTSSGFQKFSSVTSPSPGTFTTTITSTKSDGTFKITATDVSSPDKLSATASLTQTGSSLFSLSAPTLDETNGTATFSARVPGPGTLVLSGSGVETDQVGVSAAGTVALTVTPTGAVAQQLASTGQATVTIKVKYTTTGGSSSSKSKTITLIQTA